MNNNMKVLFVTSGGKEKASSRVRIFNISDYLLSENISPEIIWPEDTNVYNSDLLRRSYFALRLLSKTLQCDVIYLQKITLPIPFVNLISSISSNLVFDLDDAIYTSQPWMNNPHRNIDRVHHIMKKSDLVIAGSEAIADYTYQYCNNVEVVPSSLLPNLYKNRHSHTGDNKSVTLGWIGNPENIRYLTNIAGELEYILNKHKESNLLVITSENPPSEPLKGRSDVRYKKWSLEKQIDYLNKADIGIRPLINDEWTRAKGGHISVVQFMALSKPVVVSPVGELNKIVTHNKSGYFAGDSAEWQEYLNKLISNKNKRRAMGKAAAKSVEEQGYWAPERAKELSNILHKNFS